MRTRIYMAIRLKTLTGSEHFAKEQKSSWHVDESSIFNIKCVTLAKLTPEIELKVENWLIRETKNAQFSSVARIRLPKCHSDTTFTDSTIVKHVVSETRPS